VTFRAGRAAKVAAAAACCVLVGRSTVTGGLWPFGPALFAAAVVAGGGAALPAGLGIALGYLTIASGIDAWYGILLLGGLALALPAVRAGRRGTGALGAGWVLFLIDLAARSALTLPFGLAGSYLVPASVEGLIGALSVPAMVPAVSVVLGGREDGALRGDRVLSCGLVLAVAAIGLGGLSIGGCNVQRVFADAVVLAAALSGGFTWGAAAGTLMGLASGLGKGIAVQAAGGYAMCGAVAGVLGDLGAIPGWIGYVAASCTTALYVSTPGWQERAVEGLIAVVPAMVGMRLLRGRLRGLYATLIGPAARAERRVDTARRRLVELSGALREVSSGARPKRGNGAEEAVLSQAAAHLSERLCGDCGSYRRCWGENLYLTYRGVVDLVANAGAAPADRVADRASSLPSYCTRRDKLRALIAELAELHRINRFWARRVEESREIAVRQIEAVSGALDAVAREVCGGDGAVRIRSDGSLKYTVGVAQWPASEVSGDNYCVSDLPGDRFMLLLSDGMGTGEQAARESGAAVRMLRGLLLAGLQRDAAVGVVNSALVLRSPGETFATVDLLILDCASGVSSFTKIGAAPSFILQDGRVTVVRSSSLPIGMLGKVEAESIERRVGDHGELIVMATDGVLKARGGGGRGEAWMRSQLGRYQGWDARAIARSIVEAAIEGAEGKGFDDLTVAVVNVSGRGPRAG